MILQPVLECSLSFFKVVPHITKIKKVSRSDRGNANAKELGYLSMNSM